MTVVTQGYTREEIRLLVHEYYLEPHGARAMWLASQSVGEWMLRRWRKLVFEVDLDRNLIPRDHGGMARTYGERAAFEKVRAIRSLNTSPKSSSSGAAFANLKGRTMLWEKLSGSCTN